MREATARVLGFLGLVSLGEGLLSILAIVPHQTVAVGAGLALLGLGLCLAGRLPEDSVLPDWALVLIGAVAVAGVPVYDFAEGTPISLPKIALMGTGAIVALAGAVGRGSLRRAKVGPAVAALFPVVLIPLGVYALQASTKTLLGTTPLEIYTHYALLLPVGAFLAAVGHPATIAGDVITYGTGHGPFSLEVGVACSGIQAMGLFGGVLLLFLWQAQPSGRDFAFWSAVGLGGVYVANLLRLVVLVLVGMRWGADALETTHAQAGWVFFVIWAALFARLAVNHVRPIGSEGTSTTSTPA
jgi:exosortase/archaeosortase family protein